MIVQALAGLPGEEVEPRPLALFVTEMDQDDRVGAKTDADDATRT